MKRLVDYLDGLSEYVGGRWNRFWFLPSDALDLSVVRALAGLLALMWQLSYTPDLIRWFGPQGWLDAGVWHQWLTPEVGASPSGRFSFLFAESPTILWSAHLLSALILLAFTLGVFTRITSVLAFCVVLAYVHRAPFLCGATEVVLTMLVGYLCLAPSGQALSWDARRREPSAPQLSTWATIARRLLQVHLVMIYAVMALSKLGGGTWWNGEAVWWLSAQPLSGGLDLTPLRNVPLLLNLWTYFILLAEFGFVLCVWNPWFRPLAITATTISWLSIALATGNLALPVTMIVANTVFVPSSFWREWLNRSPATAVKQVP